MGLLGILLALGLLIWLAFRGWSVLLLAPAAALLAAAVAGEPLARPLDADLHGQRGALPRAILPAVPARRPVRQAHGRQRLGLGHRELHDRAPGTAPRRARGRARRRARDLWRRQPVRCLLRARAHGPGAVPRGRHSRPADAGGDRSRHLHLHDVGAAGNARDPERDPDAVLRHDAVRRAGPWHHRRGHHAGVRPVVAAPRGSRGPPRRRGLWPRREHRPPRPRTTRSCASLPRPRASSIPPRSGTATTATPRRRSLSPCCR